MPRVGKTVAKLVAAAQRGQRHSSIPTSATVCAEFTHSPCDHVSFLPHYRGRRVGRLIGHYNLAPVCMRVVESGGIDEDSWK